MLALLISYMLSLIKISELCLFLVLIFQTEYTFNAILRTLLWPRDRKTQHNDMRYKPLPIQSVTV